jgi:hypothetical protein
MPAPLIFMFYLIIGCLLIYCLQLLLVMIKVPQNAVIAICILLAIVLLVWLVGGGYGSFKVPVR